MSEAIERATEAAISVIIDAGGTIDFKVQPVIRAALITIRKPTPAMIKAGSRCVSCYIADWYVAEMYTKMIEEALK